MRQALNREYSVYFAQHNPSKIFVRLLQGPA